MTIDPQLSMSPKTVGFQVPPEEADENELFAEAFKDMAYKEFSKTLPEYFPSVISFRVIEVKPDIGTGIASFILKIQQDILFVPCVISNNEIKPLEIFFSRTKNKFLPLTDAWIQRTTQENLETLGNNVEIPKSLPTDVDIRNVIVPPTTGRYSYASEQTDVLNMFILLFEKDAAQKTETPLQLLNFLQECPPTIKVGFAKFLQRHEKIANDFALTYGTDNLVNALHWREKNAQSFRREIKMDPDLYIATAGTALADLKQNVAPENIAKAFRETKLKGFYVQDRRKDINNILSFSETDLQLITPEVPGLYNVWTADGKVEKVIIIPNPISIHKRIMDDQNLFKQPKKPTDFVILFNDGRSLVTDKVIAEVITTYSQGEVIDYIESITKEKPTNHSDGFLICADRMAIRCTQLIMANDVSETDNNIVFTGEFHHKIILNKKLQGYSIVYPKGQDTVMFSNKWRWFESKERLMHADVMASPDMVFRFVEHSIEKRGGLAVQVKTAGDGVMINNDGKIVNGFAAIEKIARVYSLSVPDATNILNATKAQLPLSIWSVKKGESLDPNAPPEDPNANVPPPPSGLDLAVAEKSQQIDGQIAALQQQKQLLMETQQRAQMINQGGGQMAAPMAAAGMAGGPGMLNGQQPLQPMPMQQPPAQPPQQQMPQGQQPPQQIPQGAPPPDMNNLPPGTPMPPEEPPPPPMIPQGPISPENVANQINPEFMDQAGSLQDAGVLDAAAIASLAKQKNLGGIIKKYLPNMEEALDNTGRVLLLFYIREPEIKEQIGTEVYQETEQKLRDTFSGLGEVLNDLLQQVDQFQNIKQNNVVRS